MKQKLTIREVARQAGVSSGTVSHVINGSHGVSEARRAQVMRAIDELGYVPNGLAQGLRRRRSRVIGLCAPDTASSYFAALIDTVEDIAAEQGYEVMQVLSRHDPATELRRVRALLSHQVAGLLIIPGLEPRATFDLVAETRTPTVVLDRLWDDPRFDYVTIDNRSAMRETVEALIARGHRRLGYVVSYPGLVTTRQRIEAFQATAQGAGEPVVAEVLERGESEATFRERLARRFADRDPPSAVIASNSLVTLWTLRSLRSLGLTCPDDVSLVSFDAPVWADLIEPPLSIVRQPTAEVARTGWTLLMSRIAGSTEPRQHLQRQASLVQRPSIGPPPARRVPGRPPERSARS